MKIHFICIGGIGVSALAQYYLSKGHQVNGSDLACSEITDLLKKSGAKVSIGPHSYKNLQKDTDLVIYSPAVSHFNPELEKAKKLKIKNQSYPQALGDLTKEYFTIAVSGTHGKSTTTAMISLILTKAGLDPVVVVGTKIKQFKNTNFRPGKSKYLVIEADEWKASFLNYWPKIIVLTNIEKEHLDYYKDMSHILKTYNQYVSHLGKDGVLVANKDDKNILRILKSKCQMSNVKSNPKLKCQKIFYSSRQKDFKKIGRVLKIPGKYNVYNALAGLTVARILKIPDRISLKTLSQYNGCWRRFEIKKGKINNKKIVIVSDYAHHPTEVKATLEAVHKKFPKKKIWCVYQPHQYQRTFYLFNQFVKVFSSAPISNLIITDIYDVAGRERKKIKTKISSKNIVEKVNQPNCIYLAQKEIKKYLKKNLKNGGVLIIMGAGDIYRIADELH